MPQAGEWMPQGACAGRAYTDSQAIDKVFFPTKGRPSNNPKHKSYCEPCPVAEYCLKYAVVHDLDGVWGNTSRSQREILTRQSPDLVLEWMQEAVSEGWYDKYLVPGHSRQTVEVPLHEEVVLLFDEPALDIQLLTRADFVFEFEWVEYQQKTERTLEDASLLLEE